MSMNDEKEVDDLSTDLPESSSTLKKEAEGIVDSESLNKNDTKIIDSSDNDTNEDEHLSTNRCRELKLLLALSKEAKLDTNISHKRKSIETFKMKELLSSSKHDNEPTVKKQKTLDKNEKFPITAECELDDVNCDSPKMCTETTSAEKEEYKQKDGHEERKSIADIQLFKLNKDLFCWRCHREAVNICCETCPRSYHQKCLKQTITDAENWPCPECVAILKAENTQTRSPAMKGMTLEHLCSLLKFAVKRMIECNGSEPFLHPVNDKEFPEYRNYIIQPMNLTLLEKNIKENLYGSTQAFEADAKWILHNSIIFNSYQSKLTTSAKTILKICKQEMAEIENCNSCYLNANTKKSSWFVEVCPKPHILVWAKLKGFPYWPAKAMCTNSSGMVDVRFFGAHDRAWVPSKECFLYSRRDPNSNKQKRNDIIECMREVEIYISKIKAIYGEFNYAPFKYPYEPENELKQLLILIPRYKSNGPPPRKKSRYSELKGKNPNKKEVEESVEKNEESKVSMEDKESDHEIEDFSVQSLLKENEEILETSESDDNNDDDAEIEDDNDDTQLSEYITKEKITRGGVRTRGGLNNSMGKLKIIPRRTSDENFSQKSTSSDDIPSSSKTSRRSSDQSTKSDSSRLSNMSDRINKVDITENDELKIEKIDSTDGQISSSTSDVDSKKSVQVHLNDSEVSIFPNRIKITDKLMKKLSPTEQNRDKIDVKSQTDILLEKYKNLVEERNNQFANVVASTSYGSTSICSKELCESTNDVEESKSTTPIKNKKDEKPNIKKIEIDSNELVISSTEHPKIVSESDESNLQDADLKLDVDTQLNELDEVNNTVKETVKKVVSKLQHIRKKDSTSNVKNEETEVDVDADRETIKLALKILPLDKKEKPVPTEYKTSITTRKRSEAKEKLNEKLPKKNENKKIDIKSSIKNEKVNAAKKSAPTTPVEPIDKILIQIKDDKTAEIKKQSEDKMNEVQKSSPILTKKLKTKETKSKADIKEPETLNQTQKVETEVQIETNIQKEMKMDIDVEKTTIQVNNKKEVEIMEQQVDSNSSDGQEVILDKSQIDEANIRNIIHSSLNKTPEKKEDDDSDKIKTQLIQINFDKTQPKEDNVREESKTKQSKRRIEEVLEKTTDISIEEIKAKSFKRRHIESSNNEINNKTLNNEEKNSDFKIVPIQTILNKNIESSKSPVVENPILHSKLLPQSEVSNNITPDDLLCVVIKSEPESSDTEEIDYMEKKREYLSALNISERTGVSVLKKNEIRTRSKSDLNTKVGSPLDNISKVIDEVATSYSARHELARRAVDKRRSVPSLVSHSVARRPILPQDNGEIFVKSFAKLPQTQEQAKLTLPRSAPKPKVSLTMKSVQQPAPREIQQKSLLLEQTKVSLTKTIPTSTVIQTNSANRSGSPATNKTLEQINSSSTGNVLILTQPGVILPTSQSVTYNAGSFVTFVPSQQNMTMVQTPQVIMAPTLHQPENMQASRGANIEIHSSQNYIPQNENDLNIKSSQKARPLNSPSIKNVNNINQAPAAVREIQPLSENRNETNIEPSGSVESPTDNAEDEFSLIHSLVPESVSRAISDVLCRPPPKLKPRPPGPLSQTFDSGIPSSAGTVSAKINSVSHRLADYFRGMLVETLEDLGKSNNSEATIVSLKHEIEALQHKHSLEMMDLRKNLCTILKDIQGSIAEERERIVNETRSVCELEAIRRIEEAKSKQWCANCGKEAQFYCCWNTSYCDYPCQQKHWSKHIGKCTQHAGQPQPSQPQPPQTPPIRQSQLTFRPTAPNNFPSRVVSKPTRVYLNKSNSKKNFSTYRPQPGSQLALVDKASLEFLTSTADGKLVTSNSIYTQVKAVNSPLTSNSNGMQKTILNQKIGNSVNITKALPSKSFKSSTVVSEEEVESE